MKSLLEHAKESAQKNCSKKDEVTQEIYCDGYCAGVMAAVKILQNMPEYFEARDYVEFKMGIDIY